MKRAAYKIFKPHVFNRAVRLRSKQQDRMNRLKYVVNELNKWDDIPISWHLSSLCKELRIVPDAAAKKFLIGLCIPNVNLEREVKKLPL